MTQNDGAKAVIIRAVMHKVAPIIDTGFGPNLSTRIPTGTPEKDQVKLLCAGIDNIFNI